jgi:hypothetical protein
MGQIDDAIIELEKAIQLNAESSFYSNLAIAMQYKGILIQLKNILTRQ